MLCPIKQQHHDFVSPPFAGGVTTHALIVFHIPHGFQLWPSFGLHNFPPAWLDDASIPLPGIYPSQSLRGSCLYDFYWDIWSSSPTFIAGRTRASQNIQDKNAVDLYDGCLFFTPFSYQIVADTWFGVGDFVPYRTSSAFLFSMELLIAILGCCSWLAMDSSWSITALRSYCLEMLQVFIWRNQCNC